MDVVFYATKAGGKSEVWDFISELNTKANAGDQVSKELLDSIDYCMERYEDGYPHAKPLRKGILELRPGPYRITYFFWQGNIVCLTVFRKNSRITPNYEVDRAVNRMKDWKQRYPKQKK